MMEYLQRHFNIFFYSSLLLILLPLSGMIPSPSENGVDNIESELPSNLSSQDSATSNTSTSSTSSFTITKEDFAIIEEIKAKNKTQNKTNIKNSIDTFILLL